MSLPDMRVAHANDTLGDTDIYPDSTWITFKYNVSPLASLATFANILRSHQFRQPSRRRPFGRWFTHGLFQRRVYVAATMNTATRTVSFTAQFSPLADLRDEELDYADELSRPYRARSRGIRVTENWLHSSQVTVETRARVLNHLWERINTLEPQINEIACAMVTQGPFCGHAPLLAMKLCSVELCTDLTTPYPHYHLRRLAPRFREQFNKIIAIRYGPTGRGYAELTHDANLIRGYRAAGQCMKAYEKTSNRIRLEFAATGIGLKSLCSLTAEQQMEIAAATGRSRLLDQREFRDEADFFALFDRLIAQVLPYFNAIRGNEPEPDDHGSLFELVARIAPVLRRHTSAELERAYRVLALEGRLTSRTLSSPSLARLVAVGVLQCSVPNIYVAVPRFQLALRTLRAADGRWQGRLRRAA